MAAVSMWRACAQTGRFSAIVCNRVALTSTASVQLVPRQRPDQGQWFRNYSLRGRGLRRTPVKVIMPDGAEMDHRGRDLKKSDRRIQPETIIDDSENSDSNKMVPHYIKLGENTKLFTSIIHLTRNRKTREKEGKILLEGHRLIQDAIDAGVKVYSIFFSLHETLAKLRLPSSSTPIKIYKVMYKDMQTWSNLDTCPGIMGVFQQPNYDTLETPNKSALPVTLLCDNVRDPTNLGAIIRCAAAAGCDKVLITKGCVDVWDAKVLRAASGAHFHIRLENNIPWELVVNHLTPDSALYLAAPDTNLAIKDDDDDSADLEETGENIIRGNSKWYEVTDDGKVLDPGYANERTVKRYRRMPLKSLAYTSGDYGAQSHVTVVIGGETEGLSDAAFKLAYDRDGSLVSIPLGNGVESLNSAVAAGVILFEVQRQLRTGQSLTKATENVWNL